MSARASRILVGIGFAVCAVMIALVAVAVAHPDLFARTAQSPRDVDADVVVAERPPETLIEAPIEPSADVPPPTPTPGTLKTRYPYLFATATPEPPQKRNREREEIERSPVDAAFTIVIEDQNVPVSRRKCSRTHQAGPCPPIDKSGMPLPVSPTISLPTASTADLPTTEPTDMTRTSVTVVTQGANVPFPVNNGTAGDNSSGDSGGGNCD
ncbi:MAG: hypothetical protein KJ042_04315 [Deltaproteobacteria bacterium]|nr:hypothetical protein [Deltaproteobacteria bacterium]